MARQWKIGTMAVSTALAAGLVSASVLGHDDDDDHHGHKSDFGTRVERQLAKESLHLFGVFRPVEESSTGSIDQATAEADPRRLVTLAQGLRARVVSAAANLGANTDMMVLWPTDKEATHLIACNEQGTSLPGVQRIRLQDGLVETILTGTTACDPIRRTPWGTVIVGEETAPTGHLLEIINPLETDNVVFDRNNHTFSGADAGNAADRPAVGRLAFEGIALYPSGVMYYGDENRPSQGTPGGAYFKFIPTSPWMGGGPIADLADSPLVAGTVFGLRLGKRSGNTDYGQGSNTGMGTWVEILNPGDLRGQAGALELTGYYRPEDAEIDRAALKEGNVRFCANNTGNEGDDRNWGETTCITDGTLAQALANTGIPEAHYLVIGTPELAMMDNMEYQKSRGNWIIQEDGDGPDVGRNNDLWSCLEDRGDEDLLSDGCIRIGTLNDLNAEWTGGLFDGHGRHFFVSIQHNVTGHGVILDITGWR